jgi:molybdate transport system substrate-binding protein
MNLNILSGGAAQGLVKSLAEKFGARTGFGISGDYGAVGVMAAKLRAGTPADILILTSALIADLARENLIDANTIRNVGQVETALAVREGDPSVSVHDAAGLREALLAADAIFVPDTKASTAGVHVAKILAQLGIADEVEKRLKIYPNGAAAMRQLAESAASRPIGCTQSTEIIATKGVKLSGALPKGCELATLYTTAIAAAAEHPREAQSLIDLLTAEDHQPLRTRAGFLSD